MPHVTGNIAELDALERALDEHGITNVIHLAALQIPACRADPPLGARVNVVGTVNVFEAVKRRLERMAPVVYASSIAASTRRRTESRRPWSAIPRRSTASSSVRTSRVRPFTGKRAGSRVSGCVPTASTEWGATRVSLRRRRWQCLRRSPGCRSGFPTAGRHSCSWPRMSRAPSSRPACAVATTQPFTTFPARGSRSRRSLLRSARRPRAASDRSRSPTPLLPFPRGARLHVVRVDRARIRRDVPRRGRRRNDAAFRDASFRRARRGSRTGLTAGKAPGSSTPDRRSKDAACPCARGLGNRCSIH